MRRPKYVPDDPEGIVLQEWTADEIAAGFADAVQVDHLTDEQVEQVAAIFDKADDG